MTKSATLLQQAYIDAATSLNGFGAMGQDASPADVQKAHVLWSSIADDDRHLTALCFHQFDAQRELFSATPETALEAPGS